MSQYFAVIGAGGQFVDECADENDYEKARRNYADEGYWVSPRFDLADDAWEWVEEQMRDGP